MYIQQYAFEIIYKICEYIHTSITVHTHSQNAKKTADRIETKTVMVLLSADGIKDAFYFSFHFSEFFKFSKDHFTN